MAKKRRGLEVVEVKMTTNNLMPAKAGTCVQCAGNHPSDLPHQRDSLFYQMRFQLAHGRAPTWADAAAHVDPKVREMWRSLLLEIAPDAPWDVPAGAEPIAEPWALSDGVGGSLAAAGGGASHV